MLVGKPDYFGQLLEDPLMDLVVAEERNTGLYAF